MNRQFDMPTADQGQTAACFLPLPQGQTESFVRAHLARLHLRLQLCGCAPGPHFQWFDGHHHPKQNMLTGLRRRFLFQGSTARLCEHDLVVELRRRRVRLCLAEYATIAATVYRAIARARLPLAIFAHGYDIWHRESMEPYRAEYPNMMAKAAAVFVVSEQMRERVRSWGAAEKRVHVVPCGVDCALWPRGEPAANPPNLVAVGRFVEKKAPQLTLLAFAHCRENCPEAHLHMVGDGPLRGPVEAIAAALELTDAVTFHGVLPHDRVAKLMSESRCFVQHSVVAKTGDAEGSPVAICEAMATGLPVVATRHMGIAKQVIDGETGFLVPEGDIVAMAKRMSQLLRNPVLAARLGEGGRRHCERYYDQQHCLTQIDDILQSLIGTQR